MEPTLDFQLNEETQPLEELWISIRDLAQGRVVDNVKSKNREYPLDTRIQQALSLQVLLNEIHESHKTLSEKQKDKGPIITQYHPKTRFFKAEFNAHFRLIENKIAWYEHLWDEFKGLRGLTTDYAKSISSDGRRAIIMRNLGITGIEGITVTIERYPPDSGQPFEVRKICWTVTP